MTLTRLPDKLPLAIAPLLAVTTIGKIPFSSPIKAMTYSSFSFFKLSMRLTKESRLFPFKKSMRIGVPLISLKLSFKDWEEI